MAKKSVAVDIGNHSAKVLVAEAGKHGLKVTRFAGLPRGENPVSLAESGVPLAGAVCGLAGKDMTLRYSQVPPTPDWQLRNLMDLEIQDLSQQSGGSLSADYNLLPVEDPEGAVETILLALAKDDALERLQGDIQEAKGSVAAFVPNCTALYNAYLKCGPVEPDTVVCLTNIGHETIDIALVQGTDLLFARNLTTGTKALDDAIAASFNVSARKAEALKKDLLDLDPQSRGRYASGQAEKVTMAVGGAATAISAAIQSSLTFCKAQTKIQDLRLDRVLLCGGGARLRGLRGMLRESLRCPVELFDPFANLDLSALPVEDAEQLETMRHEAVVALGLAAGRLDDTLYALEILPESVRRKQRFQQRTIFNIVAVLIAVALLGYSAMHHKKVLEAATGKARRERTNIQRARSVHNEAEALLEENRVTRAVVTHLGGQSVPLNGLLLVQRGLAKHLPPQLWIEKLDITGGRSSSRGSRNSGTTITVKGVGKEINGVNVNQVFLDFKNRLQADLEAAGAKVAIPSQPGAGNTLPFEIRVQFGGEEN
ncbi:MAG: pilus assembly protein PilM [bacterium]|nr:pilus assembly protein PilM [bacterium]